MKSKFLRVLLAVAAGSLISATAQTSPAATPGAAAQPANSLPSAPGATAGFTMPTPTSPQVAGTAFNVPITAVDQYDNTSTYGGAGTKECVIFSGPASSPGGTAPLLGLPSIKPIPKVDEVRTIFESLEVPV